MSELHAEVHARWRQMFTALAAGSDVPPSLRLRTEGLMEALALLGEVEPDVLQQQMDEVYSEVIGQSLAEDFGGRWQDFYPFPQIPAMGRRAPVFPSTPN